MTVTERLEEVIEKYGTRRVLKWIEGYLRILARSQEPESRAKEAERRRLRKKKERETLTALQAEVNRLRAKQIGGKSNEQVGK